MPIERKKKACKVYILACLTAAILSGIAGVLFSSVRFLMMLLCVVFAGLSLCSVLFWPFGGQPVRTWQRWGKRILAVCIAVGLISFAVVEGIIIRYAQGTPQPDGEYVIVLGAAVHGKTPSWSLRTRLEAAYAYLQQHPESTAILSGGQGPGEDISEAEAMAQYLQERGIASDRLWLEDQSTSTWENLQNSRQLLLQRGGDISNIVVISNTYHLYRAQYLAQCQGMSVQTVGAQPPPVGLVPLSSYVREYFGVMYMYLQHVLGWI